MHVELADDLAFERHAETQHAVRGGVLRLLSEHNYLNGEKLLDNQDLCFMLKVSTKTLQRYRKKGILPYIMLDGKYFYRTSDIHKLIRERTD